MVLPGIISRVLFPDIIGPNGENSNSAYPLMVSNLLPSGLRGLMIAAMLSALMSSLAAVFNSSATLFTMDCWRSYRPDSNDSQLVWIGRVATAVVAIISVIWAPVIPYLSDQVWVYGTMISSYLAPPLMCVSVFGVVWSRANSKGAIAAMIFGNLIGIFRFALDLADGITKGAIKEISLLRPIIGINYLEYGVCSLFLCLIVMVVVSLLTEPPLPEQIELYTFFPHGFIPEMKEYFQQWRTGAIWYSARGMENFATANNDPDQPIEMTLLSQDQDSQKVSTAPNQLLQTPNQLLQTPNQLSEVLQRNKQWNILNTVCSLIVLILVTTLVAVFA